MNNSVSPLPIPVWPLLGLSLALVSVTTTAVTLSSRRAVQQYHAQPQVSLETEKPIGLPSLRRRTAGKPATTRRDAT